MKPALIAVTSGEPAGVGPEICLKLTQLQQRIHPARLIVLGDKNLLQARANALDLKVVLREPADLDMLPAVEPGTLDFLHVPLCAPSTAGKLDPANAAYVLALLDRAIAGCMNGEFAAMVTAPVHKEVINQAGIPFTGHTEYLAEKTQTPRVVMMLASEKMRVALVTTHLALRAVADAITPTLLEEVLHILEADLRNKYGIESPRILVAGLNPHAGEGGYLGREEIEIIIPVLERLRAEGMRLLGPLPADTLFTPPILSQGDCVLAMYHDQGLTALKYSSFGQGINVTLGLPLIRTSVDHGTALELAGTGKADPGSLFEAVEQACLMISRQRERADRQHG